MQRPLIGGRVWAINGARRVPDLAKYQQGWIDEIPTYEVLNHLQYRSDLCLNALAERGVMEWGSDIPYGLNSLVWDDTDNQIYVSLVASPSQSLAPSANSAHWGKSAVQITSAELEAAEQRFDSHVNSTTNPHSVTASQAGTLTAAQIYDLTNAVQASIDSHVANTNNPHNVTAAQAGGVSASQGGRFTGQVEFAAEETLINSASAGTHALHSSATWTGLRRDNKRLGIRVSDGRAFYDDGNGEQVIMNEDEYIAFRETIEPDFAVPTPDFRIDPISSLHIPIGAGMSEFLAPGTRNYIDKSGNTASASANEPRIYYTGMRLNCGTGYQEVLVIDAPLNLQGFDTPTLFLEFAWTSIPNTGYKLWSDNSVRDDKIWVNNNRLELVLHDVLDAEYVFNLGPIGSVAEITKVAFTIDGSEVVTYRDGVETARAQMSFAPSGPWTKFYLGHQDTSISGSAIDARCMMTWAQVLTANQISTL
ncbi:hypothetical protein [Vibrio phage vB_VpaM_VPs20]|uniref:Tail fiber protein n=1 Tax=Vibrio phage vB_VpaM_VPs20 TaxID=2978980 RepID=A0A9X9JRH7_9CAUD|nr:hypothetical protein QNH06_gp34 [Vibrio phage vB_VpaM_VPs20]UYD72134.1 hypothetical protein [Vibrio phage vB_VpaM_VPs20]